MLNADSPISPKSHPQATDRPLEEEDEEMMDADQEDLEDAEEQEPTFQSGSHQESRPPRETRKDKDLNTFLNQMDKYAPIVHLY